jgi:hypothetical protein
MPGSSAESQPPSSFFDPVPPILPPAALSLGGSGIVWRRIVVFAFAIVIPRAHFLVVLSSLRRRPIPIPVRTAKKLPQGRASEQT